MKLLFATRNTGKLRELRQLLGYVHDLDLLTLEDMPGAPEVVEDGDTFEANAAKKALEIMAYAKMPALADDSGLEVDALGGAPGVYSARYAGEHASDEDRVRLLLKNLEGLPEEKRTARFRCVVAFVEPNTPDKVKLCRGSCEGIILEAPRGHNGFGYDPVFFSPDLGMTFAQAAAESKNRISHRGQAMQEMARHLRSWIGGLPTR